jgi:hypothetical protein
LKGKDILNMTDYPAGAALSRARRKAIKEALATLDGSVRLTPSRRHYAVHRIQQARSPKGEAKRLIRGYLQGTSVIAPSSQPDLGDVVEVRVRLIRRDHWLDPQVRRLLGALERAVARGLMGAEFQRRVAVIVQLKPTMPTAWRRAEAMIAREGGMMGDVVGSCDCQPLAEGEGAETTELADAARNGQAVESEDALQLNALDAPASTNPAPRRLRGGGAR